MFMGVPRVIVELLCPIRAKYCPRNSQHWAGIFQTSFPGQGTWLLLSAISELFTPDLWGSISPSLSPSPSGWWNLQCTIVIIQHTQIRAGGAHPSCRRQGLPWLSGPASIAKLTSSNSAVNSPVGIDRVLVEPSSSAAFHRADLVIPALHLSELRQCHSPCCHFMLEILS